jgi:hypothetical protein
MAPRRRFIPIFEKASTLFCEIQETHKTPAHVLCHIDRPRLHAPLFFHPRRSRSNSEILAPSVNRESTDSWPLRGKIRVAQITLAIPDALPEFPSHSAFAFNLLGHLIPST